MNWWRRLFRSNRLEQELDAELRYHFERQVADNVRSGMSEDEARRRAHAQMGGLDQVKEACRDARSTRWVEDTVQDLRFAVRLLSKDRSFTLVAVTTLALAIGANAAMFSVIESVLLTPLPYRESERMLWISENDLRGPNKLAIVFAADIDEWRKRSTSLDTLSVLLTGDATMGREEPVQVRVACVSESLSKLFGVPPVVGRDFVAQDFEFAPQAPGLRASSENRSDTGVAILSDRLFRRLGGNSAILGEPVTVNNIQYTIVGVLAPTFRLPVAPSLQLGVGPQTDADLVLNTTLGPAFRGPGALLGRLKSGRDVASAFTELDEIRKAANQMRPDDESPSHLSLQVTPLHDYVVNDFAIVRMTAGEHRLVTSKDEIKRYWEPLFMAEIAQGRDPRVPPAEPVRRLNEPGTNIGTYLNLFYTRHYVANGARSLASVRSRIKTIVEALGSRPVSDLQSIDVLEEFRAEYAEGRQVASVNRVLETIRTAINWGMHPQRGVFTFNPFGRYGIGSLLTS